MPLSAFNRTINKAEPLKELGAELSKTLSEVVKDKDCVITMLTDDSAVDAIMNNSDFLEASFATIGIEDHMTFVRQDPRFMRPSEVPYLKGSYSKAKVVLGWKPQVGFDDLVSRMVDYDIKQIKEREMIG